MGGTGIETLDGVALLGEVLVAIGVENRMPLHLHLVVGEDEAGAPDEGGTGTAIVTMITGGCHHPGGTVIPRLPGVAGVEAATVGIVEEVEEGQKTQDLAAHPAETPDTIEYAICPDTRHGRHYVGLFN